MAKIFLILILVAPVLTTCTHRWTAYPQKVKNYEKCQNFDAGPQMLKVPGYDKSYIMVHNCNTMDRQRVSIGITIFLEEWGRVNTSKFQHRSVERTMNDLLVEFSDAKKSVNGYDAAGNYIQNANVTGLAQSPTMAWVQASPGDLLCETSFAHELMHLAIWALKGTDGDPDHLGPKYHGWTNTSMIIIQNTNERLCALGI